MTENQLKELYNEEMSASAPDMEALWEKIDGRLTEKETVSVQPKKKPTVNLWRTGAFMAACAALFFVIPSIIKHNDSYTASEGIASNGNTPAVYEDAAADNAYFDTAGDAAVFEESFAEAEVTVTETSSLLNYSSLTFPDSYLKNVEFSGEPNGGEYFVEEDILVETECFIDAIVDNVYASPDGDCVYYELTAKSSYGDEDVGEYITVASRSQHEMYIGREYFIPVKVTETGLQTVFDGVPQIEVTADNGLVYYNGWESLNTELSQSILYPQNKVDDFFYDRMMFSSSGDITPLIEKWKDIHKEE
ncbi:MAG: hypothetical protein IJ007_05540 [Oscillospiraceae bacterium]|nr:hypothetical protein [Oscillospiraceae bacterium]